MRKIITGVTAACAVAAFGLAAAAPAVAATPLAATPVVAAASVIDGPTTMTPARINGKKVSIKDGTTYRMICWWDEGGLRVFYGEFTSGQYRGKYGDVLAIYVRNQTSVGHCD
jgi:hypothetical protein